MMLMPSNQIVALSFIVGFSLLNTANTIDNRLDSILKSTLGTDYIDKDASMGITKGWDSLEHMEIIFAVEKEFNISIPAFLIGELVSRKRIAEYLETAWPQCAQ